MSTVVCGLTCHLQGQSFKYKVKFGSTRKGELGLPAGGAC